MSAVTMHHFSGLAAPFVRSKGTVSGGVFMLDFAIRAGVGILLLAVGSVIVRGVKKAVRSKEQNTFEP